MTKEIVKFRVASATKRSWVGLCCSNLSIYAASKMSALKNQIRLDLF